jgi:hypothetical protein
MKTFTLSLMALATSVALGSSADAAPGRRVAGRHSTGRAVHRSHSFRRSSPVRFHHRVGVRRTAIRHRGVRHPVIRHPGIRRPGIRRPGIRRPGIRRPGIRRPGIRRVVVRHRAFVRPAGYIKRFSKRYHWRHGKRFRFGWYYPGFWHRQWTRCVWIPRYRTYCYWDPYTTQYYYWCQPRNCYYPVTYCPTGSYNYEYSGPSAPAGYTDCDTCPVQQPVPAPPVTSGCETCPVPQPIPQPNTGCETCPVPQPVPQPNTGCDTCATE